MQPAAKTKPLESPRVPSPALHGRFAWLRALPDFAYPLIGLLLVTAVMGAVNSDFLTVGNMINIARQSSISAILAVGMTYVILTGGIDLSVGSIVALVGTLMSGFLVAGWPPGLAVAAALGVGVAAGLFNGALVAFLSMPSIIVTLATMGIARGIGLIYTGGYPIDGLPDWFGFLGGKSFVGVPVPVVLMLLIVAIAWVFLRHTPFGRHVYAIGGNREATRLSGIRVRRVELLVYAISGLTAAIAGFVLASRLMSGQPNAGVSFELDAIAAVVLGGTAISGGRGSVIGTLFGALLLGVLNSGLNSIGVSPYLQDVVKGAIILIAIYISRERSPQH